MKLRILFTYLVLIVGTSMISAQRLVSATYLTSYTKEYFTTQFNLFADNGVDLYRILYLTTDVEGRSDTASGLLVLPETNRYKYTSVIYHHGTVGSRLEVPGFLGFESAIPSILGAYGFVALAPDYLGLGTSRGYHPYIHAESEAWASVHFLEAVDEYCNSVNYVLNKEVLLTGYSQGGHASMATHQKMQQEGSDFAVRAAIHMSGPYDISTGMRDLLLSEEDYPLVAYAPHVVLGLDRVYGLTNGDLSNYFKADYIPSIDSMRNEYIDLWTLNERLIDRLQTKVGKTTPKDLFQDTLIQAILADDNHPANLALRDNDVYDWTPESLTRLYYCQADEQVSYLNALTAEMTMKANGANDVLAVNINPTGNHSTCFNPSLISGLFLFLNYRSTVTDVADDLESSSVIAYPNPASDYLYLKGNQGENRGVLADLNGRKVMDVSFLKQGVLDISHLQRGVYMLSLFNTDGIKVQKIIIQ